MLIWMNICDNTDFKGPPDYHFGSQSYGQEAAKLLKAHLTFVFTFEAWQHNLTDVLVFIDIFIIFIGHMVVLFSIMQ